MSELQVIHTALEGAGRRRRWAQALRGLWCGLLVGTVLSLLLIGAFRVLPLPLWTQVVAAMIPIPCALVGLVLGGWHRIPLPQVARWVDGREHLQERLSTALEVAAEQGGGTWGELVVADAADRAKALKLQQLVPFHLPHRIVRWALPILILTAGLGFVPAYRSKSYRQQSADQANIKEAGRQLAALTRHDLQKRPPALEPTEKSLEAVTDLGDQLTKKTLSRTEAIKDLANMAEKLKDELKELGKDPAMKRLEQAARSNSGNDSQTAAGLQKQMESLQKQLGTPVGNPDAVDQFKKDLEKLAESAKAMQNQDSPGKDAERQKLSDSLSALSKQAQEMGLQMPELDDAISAMAANQPGLVLKDLQAALTDLEKMREMAKSLQQLQQQMEKLGKDLAEQLQNGQAEAAQMTLQKMISKLNASDLPPGELQKMLEEVAKAVEPAGSYGQVAQHLKNATKQLQAGDRPNAAQSLASAAKELEKLMQQLGDAQELAATLENLNQASMCIGSCQGWRACNKPGFKPGGKPGSGVGTWADDETAGWNGEFTDRWDNSGVVRPDTDPRGHSDRGEGGPTDALKPTKVKGQFSPGGQMPSITLKGVSIKGQSKVQYEEAAAAAQSEAQSALSQEKVPRAYQGTVKDYFDDIKK
jgi:hypothetical protein